MNAGKVDALRHPRRQSGLHRAGGPEFAEALDKVGDARPPRPLPRRDGRALPLAHSRSALPRVVGRRARVRRHGLADSAAHRAALRRPHGARSPRGAERQRRQRADRSRQGLLDARVRRQDEDGVDAARSRRASRSRTPIVLAARAARRLRRGHVDARDAGRRPRRAGPAAVGAVPRHAASRHGDRLPAGSERSRRPLRQQRLAAGTAEAAVEGHVGQRRVHQPGDGREARHSGDPSPAIRQPAGARDRLSGPARLSMPVWVLPGTADDVGRRALRLRPPQGRPRRQRHRRRRVPAAHVATRRGSTAARTVTKTGETYLDRLDAEPLRDGRPQSRARGRRRGVPARIRRRSRSSGHEKPPTDALAVSRRANTTATSGAWRST